MLTTFPQAMIAAARASSRPVFGRRWRRIPIGRGHCDGFFHSGVADDRIAAPTVFTRRLPPGLCKSLPRTTFAEYHRDGATPVFVSRAGLANGIGRDRTPG